MSRFISCCSQKSACGKLTRNMQVLVDDCKECQVDGTDEVVLGRAIGRAGCVGCGASGKKKAVEELADLVTRGGQDTEELQRVKGRALVCVALSAQQAADKASDVTMF